MECMQSNGFNGCNGMVLIWYGMLWYWYGTVWFGIVWRGVVWHGTVWYVCIVINSFIHINMQLHGQLHT